jgi:hypothetical protein
MKDKRKKNEKLKTIKICKHYEDSLKTFYNQFESLSQPNIILKRRTS